MKLLSFYHPHTNEITPGALVNEQHILDLTWASNKFNFEPILSIDQLIKKGDDGIQHALQVHIHAVKTCDTEKFFPLSSTTLLAPFMPEQIRCFSVYPKHLMNAVQQVSKHEMGFVTRTFLKFFLRGTPKRFLARPLYYKGVRLNVVGPEASILRPLAEHKLDYELELGVIIGKQGKNISEETALSHVFGYTIFNDVSAREQLTKEVSGFGGAGPAKGKDFDNSNIIGPWIVTRDEIPDPQNLTGTVRVNDTVRGVGNTSGMAHSVAQQIAYISTTETLYPGEFFGSGAMENCCGIEHWEFLKSGDDVELELEKIGLLKNSVI